MTRPEDPPDGTRRRRWLHIAGALVLPFVLWEIASRALLNSVLVPPPSVVARTAWEMLGSGELFVHMTISLRRIFVGFLVGSAIGTLVGAVAARSPLVNDALRPLLAVCSAVPPLALIPLVMAWFGVDEPARLFLITYLATVLMVPATMSGVINIAPIRIRAAQSLGARRADILLRVMLPDAFPFILNGLRITLGFCFMVVVAAEMIGATSGIGYLLMQSRYYAVTSKMFVGILVLGVMGVTFDAAFRRLVAMALPRFTLEKRTG